ncbi:MAG: arabinosyltransferase domain-containing protein [Pseudonocardiales bacterium]|nr:arabinosyltransferase domain-containing protein [Pseudonocardiales bacterium]
MPAPAPARAPSRRSRWRLPTLAVRTTMLGRTTRQDASAPPAPVSTERPVVTWRVGVLAGLAVLTLVAAVGVLLAPVTVDDPVVSWPQAGQRAHSTVLPLVPYRPLSLDARVPCTVLSALDREPDGGDALRTLPATTSKPATVSQGLVVAVHRGVVQVSTSGELLLREALPTGECTYQILADAGGVRVLRDGAPRRSTARRGPAALRVPEVSELATDVDGQPASAGLAVSLHTDARYESTPTGLKIGLLVVCAAALLALLAWAWRWWGGQVAHSQRPRLGLADAVLVVVSAVWVLLAPTNFDDPWYLLMARGANSSGSVSNAIYMFNVTENPFVASQYVLQAWGWLGHFPGVSWGLAWMRLVPLGYGLVTWLLLRLLLVAGFGHELGTGRTTWALLVAYLLWWLPYGMTLRPEPLIVLLAAATLLLAELARRRHSVGALVVATATAALAMSVSPSGLVAAAPLVLALPWLRRWLHAQGAVTRVATVLALAAASTSLVLVGFADATLGDVLESTAVHQWYYQTFPWYRETVHYQTILSFEDSSQWARRAPVVLTIAVLLIVAGGRTGTLSKDTLSKNTTSNDPVRRLLMRSAAYSTIALALLTPTPTKFVNHFGAAAAAPTVLLAAALLRSPLSACRLSRRCSACRLSRRHYYVGVITAVLGAATLVSAMSLSFAGPNLWRPYSDRGQPFGDHLTAAQDQPDLGSMRPTLGGVQLANPTLWVAVVLAAACGMWWWRRRGRDTGLTPDRAVLLAGSTAIVVMTIVVFVWAPMRQYPGWSVALSATREVQGEPCALADYAQVLVDTAAQPVPTGPAITDGVFAAAAGRPAPVPAPAPGTLVWHDAGESDPITGPKISLSKISPPETGPPELGAKLGLLVTPWFTLPADGGTDLLIPLLGTRAGQQLTLEYATAAGPNPAVAGSTPLPVDHTVPRTQWQQTALALNRLGTRRPSRVRLIIRGQVTGTDSWLAVGQPRLARWQPLAALTAGALVYADQLTATLLPCVNQVVVEHGIAQAPEVLVRSDEGFSRGFLDLGFELQRGGTLVPVSRCATTVRIPARLVPSGPPTLPWGRVERVVYDHPVGLVDLHVEALRRTGWTRLPTLADKNYHGDPTG